MNSKRRENRGWTSTGCREQFIFKSQERVKSFISVPCMNCGKLVQTDQIDFHSTRCLSTSKQVEAIDESHSYINEIHFKLHKESKNIQKLLNNQSYQNPQVVKYLIRLLEISQIVIHGENQSVLELQEEIEVLSTIVVSSTNTTLLAQRLFSLFSLKMDQIMEKEVKQHDLKETKFSFQSTTLQNSQLYGTLSCRSSHPHEQVLSPVKLKQLIYDTKKEVGNLRTQSEFYQQRIQKSQSDMNYLMNINPIINHQSDQKLQKDSYIKEKQIVQSRIQSLWVSRSKK